MHCLLWTAPERSLAPSRLGDRFSIVFTRLGGGKSGLHRAECQVTPGGREPTESATERIPPGLPGKGEKVR